MREADAATVAGKVLEARRLRAAIRDIGDRIAADQLQVRRLSGQVDRLAGEIHALVYGPDAPEADDDDAGLSGILEVWTPGPVS